MIPFSQFLAIPQAYGPSFAAGGQAVAFISNASGVPQLYWAEGGKVRQLTHAADRVMAIACSPTERRVAFARDVGSNENAQLHVIGADGAGQARLTFDDDAMHLLGAWRPDGQALAYTANARNRSAYDVFVLELAGGEPRCLLQNDEPGFWMAVDWSPDGQRLLLLRMASSMNSDLYEIDVPTGALRHLTPHAGEVRYLSPVYAADGKGVYCAADAERDLCALVHLRLDHPGLDVVHAPEHEVEYIAASADGRWLAWSENVDGAHALYARELATGRELAAPLPPGAVYPPPADFGVSALAFAPAARQPEQPPPLGFGFATPTQTMHAWVWDLAANAAEPISAGLSAPAAAPVPPEAFTMPELVRYPTFDGRDIPAWYFRPAGRPGERLPVVVYVHGGPEGQTQALFYPVLQYLAHRGYAVLAPNVRGSWGYGKAYLNLDNVEKRMDSVADLAAAVDWLNTRPEIDPARIAVYGGSYGGFMVLAAITHYPDRWAAAVDFVGIANFVTFLEKTGPYRRALREAEYGSLARDRALLERISPIHYVDRIRAPLLVVHGANDPRVPLGEAEQIVAALRQRKVPVELLVYPDEGHGLVKLANKLDAYPKMAAFLDRYLA